MTDGLRDKAATRIIEQRPVRGWPMFLFLLAVLGTLIVIATNATRGGA